MQQLDLGNTLWKQKFASREMKNSSVVELIENKIPAIILSKFLSESECRALVLGLNEAGMSRYTHVSSKVLKFGAVQAEYNSPEKKQEYFELASSFKPKVNDLYKCVSQTPIDFLQRTFGEIFNTDANVASEPNFGDYFAGTFRNIQGPGFIHFDFAAREAPGWSISEMSAQLSWNLYLNDDFEAGELTVHETQWSVDSEDFKVPGCYSYSTQAIKSENRFVYKPKTGDLVLFNSKNFHEIASPTSPRLTQSSFIGLRKNGSFGFWS